MEEEGFDGTGRSSSQGFKVLYGQGLGGLRVLNLNRKNVTENPLPSGNE